MYRCHIVFLFEKKAIYSYFVSSSCTPVILVCHEHAPYMRRFMEHAHAMGMTGRDFLYLYYALIPDDFITKPWEDVNDANNGVTEERILQRKEAFKVLRSVR